MYAEFVNKRNDTGTIGRLARRTYDRCPVGQSMIGGFDLISSFKHDNRTYRMSSWQVIKKIVA